MRSHATIDWDRRRFLKASALSLGAAAALESAPAAEPVRIENGFVASGGLSADGWYAAALVLDNREAAYCKGLADPGRWACAYDGQGFEAEFSKARAWRKAIRGAPRRLVLRSEGEPAREQLLAEAQRIGGPGTPRERTKRPVAAWTEWGADGWRLRLADGDRRDTVLAQRGKLRHAVVAATPSGLVLACERTGRTGPEVVVVPDGGRMVAAVPGMNPKLVSAGEDLLLLVERRDADAIGVRLLRLRGSRVVQEVALPSIADYTLSADLLYRGQDRGIYVAAESCPAFGADEQLGIFREIHTWRLLEGKTVFEPWPADHRVVPVAGVVPLSPRLVPQASGEPALAFRSYRTVKLKGTYGWDVWLSSANDTSWTPAARVSRHYGMPDTGFDIVVSGPKQMGVFTCRDHIPTGHVSQRYWTEITDLGVKPEPIESGNATFAKRYRGVPAICPQPAGLHTAPAGYQLVWADLHRHTTYSMCQVATNGTPEDHLRFVRDVLGCEVLLLTDHGHHMNELESTYVQDRVEEFAGDGLLVLYADEPNPEPGRHTIFYTADRDIFDQLRTIIISHGRARADVYRHIHGALPENSVLAITHFHGKALPREQMRAFHDPKLDVAMEAMQVRGNVMMQLHRESEGLLFPNDCLDLGLQVGLVGGTDHTFATDVRRNHFCLTGLWVRERTAEGVMEAIRARRTSAMSDGKLAIWATLDGQPMGSTVKHRGPVTIEAEFSSGRPIGRVALMRDGRLLQWVAVGERQAQVQLVDREAAPGYHWYVVTAEMETAFGSPGYGHASPFFVTVEA
jgi:hypothetical protein